MYKADGADGPDRFAATPEAAQRRCCDQNFMPSSKVSVRGT